VGDPRDKEQITYEIETLLWTGIVMYLTKQGARRQIGARMRSGEWSRNMKALSAQENLDRVAHGDSIEYLLRRKKSADDLEQVQANMIQALVRKRCLESGRLLDAWYVVAIDGVHVHTFPYEHCRHCLKKTSGGKTIWVHVKLVATLVMPNGIALPMASEWIENEEQYTKQDCEWKALKRLIKKLRQFYPRLAMCVVLDSMFANDISLSLLREQRMEGIIVFKEGSMPEVYTWMTTIMNVRGQGEELIRRQEQMIEERNARSHEERLIRTNARNRTRPVVTERTYRWMKRLGHWDGKRMFNICYVKECVDGKKTCEYTWMVSNEIAEKMNAQTIEEITNYGGRLRWKIENEDFNTQKNGGYNLEHPYSKDEVALKCWHVLLDIAHILSQLIEKGSLITIKAYGSIRNIARVLFEHFKYLRFEIPHEKRRIQIRLAPCLPP
jgi:hypothetical protein